MGSGYHFASPCRATTSPIASTGAGAPEGRSSRSLRRSVDPAPARRRAIRRSAHPSPTTPTARTAPRWGRPTRRRRSAGAFPGDASRAVRPRTRHRAIRWALAVVWWSSRDRRLVPDTSHGTASRGQRAPRRARPRHSRRRRLDPVDAKHPAGRGRRAGTRRARAVDSMNVADPDRTASHSRFPATCAWVRAGRGQDQRRVRVQRRRLAIGRSGRHHGSPSATSSSSTLGVQERSTRSGVTIDVPGHRVEPLRLPVQDRGAVRPLAAGSSARGSRWTARALVYSRIRENQLDQTGRRHARRRCDRSSPPGSKLVGVDGFMRMPFIGDDVAKPLAPISPPGDHAPRLGGSAPRRRCAPPGGRPGRSTGLHLVGTEDNVAVLGIDGRRRRNTPAGSLRGGLRGHELGARAPAAVRRRRRRRSLLVRFLRCRPSRPRPPSFTVSRFLPRPVVGRRSRSP
jgi:hypothetical protein